MGVQEAASVRWKPRPYPSGCMYVLHFLFGKLFPIPGRDKITPIFNISFLLFPPCPHLQSCFPKCHEARVVQKWVFIYPAPNTPNDAFSTLKWGRGGLSFILHVFEMGVIKSRPGTLFDPVFLDRPRTNPQTQLRLNIRPIPRNTNGEIEYRRNVRKTHRVSPFS